jgi:GTP-binding protein EngB required for normal cell division
MINKLIGYDLAETGAGETTTEIQPYDGPGYRLFDIPGRNDDISYFSMEYIAFWKGLTGRLILITATIKEMTKVFRLLDAINLRYDIVVNKFDSVPVEERQTFKEKLNQQIRECNLQGVDHVWYVSALNPQQFPHWLVMVDSLTSQPPENVSDDFDSFEYVVYE